MSIISFLDIKQHNGTAPGAIMGGFNAIFRTGSNTELRADWGIGPEMVIGCASPKRYFVASPLAPPVCVALACFFDSSSRTMSPFLASRPESFRQ